MSKLINNRFLLKVKDRSHCKALLSEKQEVRNNGQMNKWKILR